MERPATSNFVQDRLLFDAVRRATAHCLSNAELQAFAEGIKRDVLFSALRSYRDAAGGDAELVDRRLRPILARRRVQSYGAVADAPPAGPGPEPTSSGEPPVSGQHPVPLGAERILVGSKVLLVEPFRSAQGARTVRLSIACRRPVRGGARPHAWDTVRWDFSRDQLPALAMVLLGLLDTADFTRAAGQRQVMRLARCDRGLELSVYRDEIRRWCVNLDAAHGFLLCNVVLEQLASPSMSIGQALAVLARAAMNASR